MSDTHAPLDDAVARIQQAYTFTSPSLEIGVLSVDDAPVPDVRVRLPLAMMNRHGLICGATGTGKTITLQVLAERLSRAGVPVFAADIKGDLSGMVQVAQPSEKLLARCERNGQDWKPVANPVEFYRLGDHGRGIPIRATVSSFGPILLSKVLGLNQTQESSLGLVFHFADTNGLRLVDLSDLVAVLKWLTSDAGKPTLKEIGGISTQTAGVILRSVVTLRAQGADSFFGEPEFDTADLFRTSEDGRGVISMMELPDLQDRPAMFSTFIMWLLADLYSELPEVGDAERPAMVFFFDEAHLLFDGASKAFLDQVTRTVRLIRSKGVGIFFVTQNARDIPSEVVEQLGARIQHQIRVNTPADQKMISTMVKTFPITEYDLAERLTSLGIGEAVVTILNEKGAPTPVAWTRLFAPGSLMGPADTEIMDALIASSPMAKYAQAYDPRSAREILEEREAALAASESTSQNGAGAGAGAEQYQQPMDYTYTNPPQDRHDADTGRAPARTRTRQQPEPEDGSVVMDVLNTIASSGVVRSFARSAGRELMRNLFGTGTRRRTTRR